MNVVSTYSQQFKIYEFFKIKDLKDFQKALDFSSNECKILAFRGDAILHQSATDRIFRDKEIIQSLQMVSERREKYISNYSLSLFLEKKTNILAHVPKFTSVSTHTKGTIFESLLFICFEHNEKHIFNQVIDRYFDWIDENKEMIIIPETIQVQIVVNEKKKSEVKLLLNEESIETLNLKFPKLTSVIWEEENDKKVSNYCEKKMKEKEISNRFRNRINLNEKEIIITSNSDSNHSLNSVHEHTGEIIFVSWCSKSGYTWDDPYYSCCGVRKDRLICHRKIWPNPNSNHTGKLFIHSSSRKGGGDPQTMNHIPRGKPPIWKCCMSASTNPGCDIPIKLSEHDRTKYIKQYKEQINDWETQYEDMQIEERLVQVTNRSLSL